MSATTDDSLKLGSANTGTISGGHLVAKALRNEGIDTIFTPLMDMHARQGRQDVWSRQQVRGAVMP